MPLNKKLLLKKISIYSILILFAVIMIFPMLWMFLLSFKQFPEGMNGLKEIITSPYSLKNYSDAFLSDTFIRYFINSILVATSVTLCNLLFCSMTGYTIARKKFFGKNILIASVLGLLIIPNHVVMIPLYKIMVSFGWINSYFALIVPWVVSPFGVFLVKQYVEALPHQVEDAARIDGAGQWYIFFKIVMPLCKPILTVLAIYIFIGNWNAFLFPFLFTNDANYATLPVGLTFYLGKQSIDWGHLMAGASISAIPILLLFVLFQRKIIEGLTYGALKE